MCTNNPKEFWDQIKKLGLSKKNPIPMKVKKNDDLTCLMTDVESVCDVWKTEFENLYNRPAINQDRTSVDFYTKCMAGKAVLENIGNDFC